VASMAIHFTCQCGSRLKLDDLRVGQIGRCPKCGLTFKIPAASEFDSLGPLSTAKADIHGHTDRDPEEPPTIRAAAWLLYLGLVTAFSILWGTLATMKLQQRTRQMEEAQRRAEAAEQASKAYFEQAEVIKIQAIRDIASIRREMESARKIPEVTRLQEEVQFLNQHPNARKLILGKNSVKDSYLEEFTIENGVVHFQFRNSGESPIKPDFTLLLYDKNGAETQTLNISWFLTTIAPGQTSSDEAPIRPVFGPPAYYALSVRDSTAIIATGKRQVSEPVLAIGDQCIVQDEGYKRVFLATSDAAWYEMLDAQNANSVELMARLIDQGKVFSPKGGTVGVIVKNGVLSKLIRIKEGPFAGQEGWIPTELVKPLKRNQP
jgi:hypothetical protein